MVISGMHGTKTDSSYSKCSDHKRRLAGARRKERLGYGAIYFATIDLLSGYWQLGMTQRARERSAFCTRRPSERPLQSHKCLLVCQTSQLYSVG